MSRLIVRFNDSSLETFSWVGDREEGGDEDLVWQAGSLPQLSELAKSWHSVTLVIAQQDVYLTRYEIPAKASHQLLASIDYQIEDQLAQDVELQHVAIGDQSMNPVPIAVLEKTIMQKCVDLIQKNGLVVTRVVPEIFLCPWSGREGEVSLIESHESVLLRYGDFQAIKCRPQVLASMLDLVAAGQEIGTINYYLQKPEPYETLRVDKYPGNLQRLVFEQLIPNHTGTINFLQRQFQITSAWSKLLRAWKWVLGLLLVLLAVTGYNRAIALNHLEERLDEVKTAQFELLQDYLPDSSSPSDDLKSKLIALLKQSQSANGEVNFLELLRQFTEAKNAYASIQVGKIGYQNQRLSIDITSNQLNEIESLLAKIESSGQPVNLENLNIKPDLISGQFILQGVSR